MRQPVPIVSLQQKMKSRLLLNKLATALFFLATMFGLIVLAVLLVRVFSEGISWINVEFLTGKLSTNPNKAGIMGAILGTLWLMLVVIPITIFLGVGTAIYLEVYAKESYVRSLIEMNISNLAGVPS